MASIIKVDTIQKPDGTAPTAADLGVDVTSADMPEGSVIQVVSKVITTSESTTSSSWTNSSLFIDITPKFNNSKILVTGNVVLGREENDQGKYVRLIRDSVSILDGGYGFAGDGGSGYSSLQGRSEGFEKLDSPNTTNVVRYRIQYRISQGGALWLHSSGNNRRTFASTITATEIKG